MTDFFLDLLMVTLAFFYDHWRGIVALSLACGILAWCFCSTGNLVRKKW